jgi:hypothetical protein
VACVIGSWRVSDVAAIATRRVSTATTTNPYAFANNDPVNGSDPSGLECMQEGTPCVTLDGTTTGNPSGAWVYFGGEPHSDAVTP